MPSKAKARARKQKGAIKPLSNPRSQLGSLMSTFGDNEPIRNQKELTLVIHDWFLYRYPDAYATRNNGRVFSYLLDLTQNFFAPDQSAGNTNETKNRIKSVTLEALSPYQPIQYVGTFPGDPPVEDPEAQTSLPLVVSACPVLANDTDSGSSLVGQQSTVVHVDQRQAWIKVAHWDWHSIFSNSQLLPNYPSAQPESVELFRLSVADSINGQPLVNTSTPFDRGLSFRVAIEIACPITLVPNPAKYLGRADVFAGAGFVPTYGDADQSPVQYQLKGLSNLF